VISRETRRQKISQVTLYIRNACKRWCFGRVSQEGQRPTMSWRPLQCTETLHHVSQGDYGHPPVLAHCVRSRLSCN